jgi:hypothetical protein
MQWFSLPKQARPRPKSLPDGRVVRWLDGHFGEFRQNEEEKKQLSVELYAVMTM